MDLDQIFVIAKQQVLAWLTGAGASVGVVQVISSLINIAAVLAVFLTLFALISVIERKVLARIQNRYGPNRVGPFGLLQPVADGIKMLIKEDIVPHRADAIVHFIAPVVMCAAATLTLCVIPYGRNMTPVAIDGGVLLFFAAGAPAELAVFMAGWGSNNKYSMLGAMRAIAQMVSYELPLLLAALPVVMITGSLSPDEIVAAQGHYSFGTVPHWFAVTPWGAVAFLLFFMAEYFGMFAVSGLGVTLFLGGWTSPVSWLEWIPSYIWFFLKLSVLLLLFLWIRGTLPRLRMDQVMSFAWKFMLPMAFVCIVAAAVWHYAGRGLIGWVWSLAIVVVAYLPLTKLLWTGKKFAVRQYRFAE